MKGKFYGVGVGPGDPELVTIKAKRIIERADVLLVPITGKDKKSLALSIVENLIPDKSKVQELNFPMSYDEGVLSENWDKSTAVLKSELAKGKEVAFLTLGDPSVYSTYIYLHRALEREGYKAEIIPGITSFCAASARLGIGLAENKETLAIIPAAYECSDVEAVLDKFDNIVLMKVARNISKLKNILVKKCLHGKAVMVRRCGLDGEFIECDVEKFDKYESDYFTTVIVKKNGVL